MMMRMMSCKIVLLNHNDILDVAVIKEKISIQRVTHFISVPALYSYIIDGMENNLCRCGAHKRIVEAIQDAANSNQGGA